MTRKLTAIDLFAGCGGLTQGLKDSGYAVLGAVEVDEKARHTYTLNHPEVKLAGSDIRKLSAQELMESIGLKAGELDLLAGCPPCQGFSTLRARAGKSPAADSRNKLIDDFGRIAVELNPKYIMMENVPALANYDGFKKLVSKLERRGYSVIYETLDAANYFVPQRRKRLILCASRIGRPKLAKPSRELLSVRSAIGYLGEPGSTGDEIHDIPSKRQHERTREIISLIPKDGGSRHSLPQHLRLACHSRVSGFNDVYGRMAWESASPTITSGCTNPSKGRFIHPEHNRPITLREAALLQGFPPDYKFEVRHGKEAIALMIGNALPPPFIAAQGKAIAQGIKDGSR